MTSKRLALSIPLAGMALTSVGCGDPIVADFAAVTAFDQALPFDAVYDYQGYTITATNIDISNMVVAEDLTTTVTNTGAYVVVDAQGVEVASGAINVVFNGTVTVVEKGAKYNIDFVDAADATNTIALTCDLADNVDLTCTDANALAWAFAAQ